MVSGTYQFRRIGRAWRRWLSPRSWRARWSGAAPGSAGHVPADRRQSAERARALLLGHRGAARASRSIARRRVDRSVGRAGRADRSGRARPSCAPSCATRWRPARRAQCRGVMRLPTGFALVQRLPDGQAASMRSSEILAVAAVGSVSARSAWTGSPRRTPCCNSVDKPEDWNQRPRQICDVRQQAVGNVKAALSTASRAGARADARGVLRAGRDGGPRRARPGACLRRRDGARRSRSSRRRGASPRPTCPAALAHSIRGWASRTCTRRRWTTALPRARRSLPAVGRGGRR